MTLEGREAKSPRKAFSYCCVEALGEFDFLYLAVRFGDELPVISVWATTVKGDAQAGLISIKARTAGGQSSGLRFNKRRDDTGLTYRADVSKASYDGWQDNIGQENEVRVQRVGFRSVVQVGDVGCGDGCLEGMIVVGISFELDDGRDQSQVWPSFFVKVLF